MLHPVEPDGLHAIHDFGAEVVDHPGTFPPEPFALAPQKPVTFGVAEGISPAAPFVSPSRGA
jgi:hypothetical protein